jgi:hypothetical protein
MARYRKTSAIHDKTNGKAREYKGEKLGKPLVEFLNACKGSDVHALVRDCRRLDDIAGTLDWTGRANESDRWIDFWDLKESIHRRLVNYTSHPAIEINEVIHNSDGEAVRRLHEDRGAYFVARVFHNSAIPQDSYIGVALMNELRPVTALLEIVNQGLIGKIRNCELDDCGKYFFARSPIQLYCPSPSTCKQRRYDHSPKAKAQRKNNLALHKLKSIP